MKYLIIVMLVFSSSNFLNAEGFELKWRHGAETIQFSLTAPTTGWVAVGFSETGDLIDSNLIQGRVKNGEVFIQDQFITGFGEHPPVEALAVPSRISKLEGVEKDGKTTISFSITKGKMDKLHYDLSEGKEINVWLAYSVSDDFDHHSRKRILRKIVL